MVSVIKYILVIVFSFSLGTLSAHHYKGLPHYAYFDNYPQVPVEEFLGQAGEYELSLVIYDFQGMKKESVYQPDDVRLYLIIFNLKNDKVYKGAATLEILNKGHVIFTKEVKQPEEENVYQMNQKLSSDGDYSIRVVMKESGLSSSIPFELSSQKIAWGKWIFLVLLFLTIFAAYGARKKRILLDRKGNIEN